MTTSLQWSEARTWSIAHSKGYRRARLHSHHRIQISGVFLIQEDPLLLGYQSMLTLPNEKWRNPPPLLNCKVLFLGRNKNYISFTFISHLFHIYFIHMKMLYLLVHHHIPSFCSIMLFTKCPELKQPPEDQAKSAKSNQT